MTLYLVKHSEIIDLENKNAEIASFPQTTEAIRNHYAVNPFLVISSLNNIFDRHSHTGS
jgi:hypothetical protein